MLSYSAVFPSAFALAHLALAAAASFALTAALTFLFLAGFSDFVAPFPLYLAQRALAAAAMAAFPAALNLRLPFFAGLDWDFDLAQRILRALARALRSLRLWAAVMRYLRLAGVGTSWADGVGISPPPAAMESIWFCRVSICSLMAIMLRIWLVVKSLSFVMPELVSGWGLGVNGGNCGVISLGQHFS